MAESAAKSTSWLDWLNERDAALARAQAAEEERDENEGVFKAWRRRCEEAEAQLNEAREALSEISGKGHYEVQEIARATLDSIQSKEEG